ncbi:MAG: type I-MYXAN CRISPR-associated protein Cas6/Cmx6 [Gammaproteobacteria bacterium]|nr:type I-MYXAN CRISPR-associated protein Cas6/Cmx6 [Gammaproteobacteria bacterium]
MYWQENKENNRFVVTDDIVDVAFNIQCRCLPVDHAYALSQAIMRALPWFADEARAGLHTIHVAESANGWMRPDNASDLLYLSRRTKLTLRLPKHRIEDAAKLTGQKLDIDGNAMLVEKGSVKLLSTLPTVFSRYVVTGDGLDEDAFLQASLTQLNSLGIRPKKMLCGIERVILTPDRHIRTRSLMLAELSAEESVKLQQQGLSSDYKLGCGIFIPHKDIKEVQQALD